MIANECKGKEKKKARSLRIDKKKTTKKQKKKKRTWSPRIRKERKMKAIGWESDVKGWRPSENRNKVKKKGGGGV